MTAVDEGVELDVDLDKPIPCDVEGCTGVAVWFGHTTCCNGRNVVCEQCYRVWWGEYFRTQQGSASPHIECLNCSKRQRLEGFVIWRRL